MRLWLLLLLLSAAAHVSAAIEITEVLPSGAHIRIAVPSGWQAGDTLLLYQHGFDMDADNNPDLGPLRDLQLSQGYAIAASGYAQAGWAVFTAADDNRDLVELVSTRFGAPGALITMGGSMGGLIALKLAESPGFERTVGVYSLCPAAAGARTWDSAFDLRLAFDATCLGVGGGELPDGDAPFDWAYNLSDIPESMGDLGGSEAVQQTYARVHQCTGIALPSFLRTPPQRERLARLMAFGEFTTEDFFLYNFAYATFALGDLVRAPDKMGVRNPFTSQGVDYGDDLINTRVPRFTADPLAAFDFFRASSLNGRAPALTRVVSLHTDGDELVRLSQQHPVRTLYGARALSIPVDEAIGTHCGFNSAELVAGWEQLRGMIATPNAVADASALEGHCTAAMAQGSAGPCRFAPQLDIGELETTMRARDATATALADTASAAISGSWYNTGRSGEGVLIERFNARQATVVWFTYAPEGEPPGLVWLGGVGEIDAHGIHVADVRRMHGARFGAAFNPADVVREPWGSFDLAFDGFDVVAAAPRLHLRWAGPPGYGSGQLHMQRLLPIGPATPTRDPRQPEFPRDWQYSGTWFDRARSGEGWFVQSSGAPMERLTSLAWFTYDLDGTPMWLTGAAVEQNGQLSMSMYRTRGTRFGAAFDPGDVVREVFGELTLAFSGCDRAELRFDANDPLYGAFTHTIERLTRPDIVSADCAAARTILP